MSARPAILGLALALALAVAGSVVPGCGDEDVSPPAAPPPLPDLDGVEPAVAAAMRRARAAVVEDPSAETWARYGRVLHVHGELEEAARVYGRGAELGGDLAFECLYLAGCALETKDPERALGHLGAAVALRDAYAPAWLRIGRLHEQLGRRGEAHAAYARALELEPSSHAELGLARLALARDDPAAAVAHLKRAEKLRPDHREVQETMARAQARLGRSLEAARAAERAGTLQRATGFSDSLVFKVMREGVSYKSLEQLALAYLGAGRLDLALARIQDALRARPASVPGHLHLANIQVRRNRYAEALAAYEVVLAASPDHLESLTGALLCARALDREDEAARYRDRIRARYPEHPWAR